MPFGSENINNFYGLGEVDESRFLALRENINWQEVCKDLTDNQAHYNTTRKVELTWFPSSLLTLFTKIWFYFVITKLSQSKCL